MKKIVFITVVVCLCWMRSAQSAATGCELKSSNDTKDNDLTQIIRTVQCSLQKSNWVEELEKEAKRLEETAKRFSVGVITKLSHIVSKWAENDDNSTDTLAIEQQIVEQNLATISLPVPSGSEDINADEVPAVVEEIQEKIQDKCAEGQERNEDGKCKDSPSIP